MAGEAVGEASVCPVGGSTEKRAVINDSCAFEGNE